MLLMLQAPMPGHPAALGREAARLGLLSGVAERDDL